ncbi:GntR family transcriptional regulator [Glycomyces artemisiae]|uniref:GntR family transcriptional regulator n=1 Tax=Glycomyces artemisiae TaxID=1076443 RepID=UPI000D075DCF|nr:GntR family transcriptional regulator [Glycomyces artemisiae]
MAESAYVDMSADLASKIRSGEYPPGLRLPSYSDLEAAYGVSNIVVRRAIDLLELQGLVKRMPRKGVFVSSQTRLIRVSPERQMESAEETYRHESNGNIKVEREVNDILASPWLRDEFKLSEGDAVTHTVTRASDDGKPASISDTYQPIGRNGTDGAYWLEETWRDDMANPVHRAWLGVGIGTLVKKVHQRWSTRDGQTLMVSDVSYPPDRYDAFVFRMALGPIDSDQFRDPDFRTQN